MLNEIEKEMYVDLLLMCNDDFRTGMRMKPIWELDSVVRFIVKMKIYWFIRVRVLSGVDSFNFNFSPVALLYLSFFYCCSVDCWWMTIARRSIVSKWPSHNRFRRLLHIYFYFTLALFSTKSRNVRFFFGRETTKAKSNHENRS